MIKYFIFIFTLGLIAFVNIRCNQAQKSNTQTDTPPNILVILIDDAGYADFGYMGSKDLQTPWIDKLAQQGVIFTDAHVSATVCAPSRAGLITGRYQQRFGHECNGTGNGLGTDTSETTIADVLQAQDYQTIAIGKWHLGEKAHYQPNQRGFDEFYGFLSGARSYFPLKKPSKNKVLKHNQTPVKFEGYLTDVLGDKAVEYIDTYKDKPFFMYLAFNAVHTPMEAKEEHLVKYADHPRKELAAMTWSLDENIGKILQKLEQESILDNTLIFFLSDNGGAHNNQSSCAPLKGWKGNKFEGGHRVPFVVSWPKQLKGGQKYEGLTSSLDIFATSMKAAGIQQTTGKPLDGVDLMPYLQGKKEGAPHQQLFWRKDKMAAVREGNQKLIRLDGFGTTHYNLDNDLGESIDLSKKLPEESKSLIKSLENWEENLMQPLWIEGEQWNQVTYEIHQALMENRPPAYTDPGGLKKHKQSMDK